MGGSSMRQRLVTQRPLIGLLQTHPSAVLAEMAGMCGYDFVLLDCKHGVWSESEHLQALRALAATDVVSMIRLAGHDAHSIGRYLDMGVDVIVAPNVETADQARMLVGGMDYPPAGTRGFGASVHRGTRYGLDFAGHVQAPRGDALLVASIESVRGAENVAEILAVEGVAGALVIPSNLTATLGCFMDFSHPAYEKALLRIEQAAAARGKIVGTGPVPGYPLEALVARGHGFLIVGVDMSLIRDAMSARVASVRRDALQARERQAR